MVNTRRNSYIPTIEKKKHVKKEGSSAIDDPQAVLVEAEEETTNTSINSVRTLVDEFNLETTKKDGYSGEEDVQRNDTKKGMDMSIDSTTFFIYIRNIAFDDCRGKEETNTTEKSLLSSFLFSRPLLHHHNQQQQQQKLIDISPLTTLSHNEDVEGSISSSLEKKKKVSSSYVKIEVCSRCLSTESLGRCIFKALDYSCSSASVYHSNGDKTIKSLLTLMVDSPLEGLFREYDNAFIPLELILQYPMRYRNESFTVIPPTSTAITTKPFLNTTWLRKKQSSVAAAGASVTNVWKSSKKNLYVSVFLTVFLIFFQQKKSVVCSECVMKHTPTIWKVISFILSRDDK